MPVTPFSSTIQRRTPRSEIIRTIAGRCVLPTWHAARAGGALGVGEKAAADKSTVYATTPKLACSNSLDFLTLVDGGPAGAGSPRRGVTDVARERKAVDALGRTVMTQVCDMNGAVIRRTSMEMESWMSDIGGKAIARLEQPGTFVPFHLR